MAKKNYRITPKSIYQQITKLKERYIVVGCLKIYSSEQLLKGALKHLGIELSSGEIVIPNNLILPPISSGKYSKENTSGREIIRRDLPKETHYNPIESPNYGDWYNGSHTVNLPYEKFPRDFIGPEYIRINIKIREQDKSAGEFAFTFELDKILDIESQNFESDLLICLNILQENIGTIGVQKTEATLNDYLQTTRIDWEILPPGTREEAIERIFSRHKSTVSQELKQTAGARYDFFMKLKPQKLVYGASGLDRYFGALLNDNLVVFENVEYGNAIYIMYNKWQELSKRTRTELLSGRFGKEFDRVPHTKGWKNKVKSLLKNHNKKQ